jgi:hypothetical protein
MPGAPRVDWSHLDADRACVECFFGGLKRTFSILRDDAFRPERSKLEQSVTLPVAILNFRRRFRGYALSSSPPGFQRAVPISANPPPGASLQGIALRPAHRPIVPTRFLDRRAEEVQLPLDSLEVPYSPRCLRGGERPFGWLP